MTALSKGQIVAWYWQVVYSYDQCYRRDSGVGGGNNGDITASAKDIAVWRCVFDNRVNSCGRDLNCVTTDVPSGCLTL